MRDKVLGNKGLGEKGPSPNLPLDYPPGIPELSLISHKQKLIRPNHKGRYYGKNPYERHREQCSELEFSESPSCWDVNGVWRKEHSWDKDERCIFCGRLEVFIMYLKALDMDDGE